MSNLKKNVFSFWCTCIAQHKTKFVFILLTMSMWSIVEAFYPFLIKLIVDDISYATPLKDSLMHDQDFWVVVFYPTVTYLVMIIGLEICMRVNEILQLNFLPHIKGEIRQKMLEHVQGHSYSFFQENMSGIVAARIENMVRAFEGIFKAFIHGFFPVILAFLFSSILLWHTNPRFSVFLIIWFISIISISVFFAKKTLQKSYDYANVGNKLAGVLADFFRNILIVKVFSKPTYRFASFKNEQEEVIRRNKATEVHVFKIHAYQGFLTAIMMISMYFLLIHGWKYYELTAGDFAFIMITTFSMTRTIFWSSEQIVHTYREWGSAQQAFEMMKMHPEESPNGKGELCIVDKGTIEFKNISFRYPSRSWLFKNLNLVIRQNQKVGIVGLSGSGKTTFVNLLLKFFEPNDGQILIDGQDIQLLNVDELRSQISIVFQDPYLFNETILGNISYGQNNVTEEEIIAATKIAQAHDFIEELEDKYNSLVGEMGVKLSTGQKQRITIARALLKNAPIFILDEATSALDSITERKLQEGLEKFLKNKTTIVIAHRLSTLKKMDRILVFKEGQLIGDGAHEELVVNNVYYAELWHTQNMSMDKLAIGAKVLHL